MRAWMTALPVFSVKETTRLVLGDTVVVEVEFRCNDTVPAQVASGAPEIPSSGQELEASEGTYYV